MDIYDYAMQLEKDGELYYRELSGRVVNAGLKNILTMLADAEVKHYELFGKMKRNEPVEVPDSPILDDVKNIFVKMRDEGEAITDNGSEVDLYARAQQIEEKTRDFYREKAGEVADPRQKQALLRIADEEQRHFLILENIIEFVSRPFTWLENAEWYHLEEY